MKVIRLCIVVSKHEACSFTAAYVTKIVYRKDALIQILKYLLSDFYYKYGLIFAMYGTLNRNLLEIFKPVLLIETVC